MAFANEGVSTGSLAPPRVVVEVEEELYRYQDPANGAGPLWCRGSTCLVRWADRVFASGLDVLPDVPPLNNCRWTLWTKRDGERWEQVAVDREGRTREPAPLVVLGRGQVLLSGNPTLAPPTARAGPARPDIWVFAASEPRSAPERIFPVWEGEPPFTEHSYRSFAADGPRGEWILFQNIGYTHAEWSFCDAEGRFISGKLHWPFGHEYPQPQPIRVCYPTVALVNRAVYFCGVSDIFEPYPEWRAYKFALTGRDWDYDFRRLFFTWCDDITDRKFRPWIEISSRDKTAGWITPCDLWVEGPGRVHLLWIERAIDERLRPKFFPKEKQFYELRWALVVGDEPKWTRVLHRAEEGGGMEIPTMARFHVTPDGRLFAIYYVSGRSSTGGWVAENRMVALDPAGKHSEAVRVPLQHPFDRFFVATPRAGCLPDWRLDLLGTCPTVQGAIRYACVRVLE
ncbi:MAG: hypothetical protein NZ899_06710 [Thermoguttaceae bacterium]|nr:hypothetical protein [Thermoguttaceae bacterium]MDW8078542.1 hypothetical protein [Thermoguttaceae bacterium]